MWALRGRPPSHASVKAPLGLRPSPGFGTPLFFHQTDRLHFSKGFIGSLVLVSAACGLLVLSNLIGAYQWWRLLLAVEIRIPLWKACAYSHVGLFFNNFFEGLFGGPSGLVGIPKPGRLLGLVFDSKLALYWLMAAISVVVALALWSAQLSTRRAPLTQSLDPSSQVVPKTYVPAAVLCTWPSQRIPRRRSPWPMIGGTSAWPSPIAPR